METPVCLNMSLSFNKIAGVLHVTWHYWNRFWGSTSNTAQKNLHYHLIFALPCKGNHNWWKPLNNCTCWLQIPTGLVFSSQKSSKPHHWTPSLRYPPGSRKFRGRCSKTTERRALKASEFTGGVQKMEDVRQVSVPVSWFISWYSCVYDTILFMVFPS